MLSLTLTLVGLAIVLGSKHFTMTKQRIQFWVYSAPYSADPLEYDAAIHHLTVRSVLSPLVTQYRLGQYVGLIADNWEASPDFREWKFHIRSGMTFENGDAITSDIVIRSWLRFAYLQKHRGSKSGFLELLKGFENITSPSSSIEGLKIQNDWITLSFVTPLPKLLDTISFGLYSVTHPNDYDSKTGEWENSTSVISSGAYKIKQWDNHHLLLEARKDYPAHLFHEHKLEEINFKWNPSDRVNADIIAGDSNEESLKQKWDFHGSVTSSIAYITCQSWTDPKSPCHDISIRRQLRDKFYQNMSKLGAKPTLSFFPLAIKGIKEASLETSPPRSIYTDQLRFRPSALQNPFFITYNQAIQSAAVEVGMKPVNTPLSFKDTVDASAPGLPSYPLDMAMWFTGILIDDPSADIRFMFLSKEGIQLTDTDGSIHQELSKSIIDVQQINELIWEQAVIWPVGHFATGLWAKDDLDFSNLNTALPPTELQWIGWKN